MWLIILINFFNGCTCCSSYGYASRIVTLKGSVLVNNLDWELIFIWVISWFTCWSFSWYPPLTATLGGTAGGILSWVFSLEISISPCVYFLVWLVCLLVLNYVLHQLNPMRHELLYLWRNILACWIVLGKTVLCLISFTLCFGGELLMAYVVLNLCSHVPAVFSMWRP